VNSIEKIFLKRKKRFIPDGMPLTMFRKITFDEYLHKRNPYSVFVEYNQIEFTKEDKEKYLDVVKHPDDLAELMDDLNIIGKREVGSLIKWRDRLRMKLKIGREKDPLEEIEEEKPQEEKEEKKLKLGKKQFDSREDDI